MTPLLFSYREYPVTNEKGKVLHTVFRPVIPVRISYESKSFSFFALIDSGADECLFPAWLAIALGHNLLKGRTRQMTGIGGTIHTYSHKTYMEIGGIGFRCDSYYSHAFDHFEYGLISHGSLFRYFDKVDLDYPRKLIALTPAQDNG